MNQNRAADVLAQRFYAAGCRYAFGMPGGEVLTILDALERAGITFILTKHENAAAFMAEGVYHRTGAPALLVATVGPGALNCVNAVENARQDRVPLILLAGSIDATEVQTYTHQVLDQMQLFRTVTKASFTLEPDAAAVIADKAVNIAMDRQQGPVYIDVPISAADTLVDQSGASLRAVSSVGSIGPETLSRVSNWLSQAKRPLMVVGLDALTEKGAQSVRRAAEMLNMPVITTYKAKGVLAEDHALCLGAAGLSPKADTVLIGAVGRADFILTVGYDPIEMRVGWRDPWNPSDQTVVELTTVPNTHYMHHATVSMVGDVAQSLDLIAQTASRPNEWPSGEVAAINTSLAEAFPRDDDWGPAAVIDTCQQELPRNCLASADSGAHRILLSQMWQCSEPRGLVQSSGFCTMGCAVPLAIGMSVADPGRTVVSFSGDAGFLMVAGELSTAAELGLRTIFVVFVDASLALIEKKQRERQLGNAGVDFGTHDFAAIGRAMGGQGANVKSRAELAEALQAAQESDSFTVIAAYIDRRAYDGRI